MSRIISKKRALLGLVATMAIAAVAIAYWTVGGSGTGSASTEGASTALSATQTGPLTAMFPGDAPQTLSGTVTNPNNEKIYVTNVVASISSVTKAEGAPAGDCDATDYSLTSASMPVGQQVNGSNGTVPFSGAQIQFNNKSDDDQNACRGATVNLAYTVN